MYIFGGKTIFYCSISYANTKPPHTFENMCSLIYHPESIEKKEVVSHHINEPPQVPNVRLLKIHPMPVEETGNILLLKLRLLLYLAKTCGSGQKKCFQKKPRSEITLLSCVSIAAFKQTIQITINASITGWRAHSCNLHVKAQGLPKKSFFT